MIKEILYEVTAYCSRCHRPYIVPLKDAVEHNIFKQVNGFNIYQYTCWGCQWPK